MGQKKRFSGTVISNKMQKTIVIRVMRQAKHPKYGKIMRKFTTFKAHDENNTAKIGDVVLIEESRPLSRDKNFRLVKIVKKALVPAVELKEEAVEAVIPNKDKGQEK
jgi:small subunit ribosomal protein S17